MCASIAHPLFAAALTVSVNVLAGEITTTALPSLPDEHGFAGAFSGLSGDKLLAGGGANFPDGIMPWNGGRKVWHDTLYSLDLKAPENGWKVIGRLPQVNGYGLSLTVREGLLIVGGGNADRNFKESFLLSLGDDGKPVCRQLPPLPTPLAQMSAAMLGRCVHLCGGIEKPDAVEAVNAHWMLDLDDQEKGWQPQPALPAVGRLLATAAAVNDSFYFMGGCSLAADAAGKPVRTYLRDAWKFSGGHWSRIADLPRASVASASPSPVRGHSFYLVSGDDGTQVGMKNPEAHKGFARDVLCYDTSTDRWSSAGDLTVPPPVTVAVTPWKDGYVFFNGEVRPGVRTPAVFLFTPPAHE